jgi:hypothetical protein
MRRPEPVRFSLLERRQERPVLLARRRLELLLA